MAPRLLAALRASHSRGVTACNARRPTRRAQDADALAKRRDALRLAEQLFDLEPTPYPGMAEARRAARGTARSCACTALRVCHLAEQSMFL